MKTFMWMTCFLSFCIVGQQHAYNIEECLHQIFRDADKLMNETDVSSAHGKVKSLSKKKELSEDDKELLLNRCKRHEIVKREVNINSSNVSSTDRPTQKTSSVLSGLSLSSSVNIAPSSTDGKLETSLFGYYSNASQLSNSISSTITLQGTEQALLSSTILQVNLATTSVPTVPSSTPITTTIDSFQSSKLQVSTSTYILSSEIIKTSSFNKVVTSTFKNTTATPVLLRVETRSLVILIVVGVFCVFICYLVAFGLHGKTHSFNLSKNTKGDLSEFDRLTSVKVPNMYGINKTDKPIDVKKNEAVKEETDNKSSISAFDNIALEQRE